MTLPASDTLNSTAARVDIAGETWPEGDLTQIGGGGPTLMPGVDTFILPLVLPQLWSNTEPRKITRLGHPDDGKEIVKKQLRLDKNNPLIIADGPRKDETLTAVFTGFQRPRGKKDDPKTQWSSDLALLLDIGLGDKSRPTTADAMVAAINKHAGKRVRIEHGLSAQCRKDKVRYIQLTLADGSTQSVIDPSGATGCGKRYYTKDFKDPETGEYEDTIACDCSTETVTVVLRGFPSVERFLPSMAVTLAPHTRDIPF